MSSTSPDNDSDAGAYQPPFAFNDDEEEDDQLVVDDVTDDEDDDEDDDKDDDTPPVVVERPVLDVADDDRDDEDIYGPPVLSKAVAKKVPTVPKLPNPSIDDSPLFVPWKTVWEDPHLAKKND
jgi:hypothetical protein